MSEQSDFYFQITDTSQFIPTDKIMRDKEYPSDVLGDDLLGLTDFGYISEFNERWCEGEKGQIELAKPGAVRLFKIFSEPVMRTPERFEYFGFKDVLEQYRIALPRAENPYPNCDHLPIIHNDVAQVLLEAGFVDFRTYPLRVYYISKYHDIYRNGRFGERWSSEEALKRFEFNDQIYSVFQLTNACVQMFTKESRKKAFEIYEYYPGLKGLEFDSNAHNFDLPILFRINYSWDSIYCNIRGKELLSQFNTIVFTGGSYFHRKIKGNPVSLDD
jgi:hypothetical protein